MPDEEIPDPLWHQSGVNQKGEPFIQLLMGTRVIGQMTPQEAREHALAMLMAVEASEQDAFMLSFLQDEGKVGLDLNRAMQVLVDFRAWRVERTGKRGGPTNPRDWVMPPDKERCSVCGAALVHVAGPNVKGTVCPICDADSSALQD